MKEIYPPIYLPIWFGYHIFEMIVLYYALQNLLNLSIKTTVFCSQEPPIRSSNPERAGPTGGRGERRGPRVGRARGSRGGRRVR